MTHVPPTRSPMTTILPFTPAFAARPCDGVARYRVKGSVLPCDGVPRYRVKGSVLQVALPYSTAYAETFKLSGGYEQAHIVTGKPERLFTRETLKRIAALNQLHLPHAKRWLEAYNAAQALLAKPAPAPVDNPVEQATKETCQTPPSSS